MKSLENEQELTNNNTVQGIREIIVPDMTSMEKYEILVMSLLATYISSKEMRLGYWIKKIAFILESGWLSPYLFAQIFVI